jgi:hypothetical protein
MEDTRKRHLIEVLTLLIILICLTPMIINKPKAASDATVTITEQITKNVSNGSGKFTYTLSSRSDGGEIAGSTSALTLSKTSITLNTASQTSSTFTISKASGYSFSKPGIYQYKLTTTLSSANNLSITSGYGTIYLDVYVGYASSTTTSTTLYIKDFVLYNSSKKKMESPTLYAQTSEQTRNITISNTTDGDGANSEQYFCYTLVFKSTNANGTYTISPSNVETSLDNSNYLVDNLSGSYSQPTTVSVSTSGTTTIKYYLKSGSSITIQNVPESITCTVTQTTNTYYTTTSSSSANTISFKNTRNAGLGSLTIKNQFSGNDYNSSDTFDYIVTLSGLKTFKSKDLTATITTGSGAKQTYTLELNTALQIQFNL